MVKPIRVLVVDDAVVVRRAVSEALESDPGIEVVGTAANGKIALSKIELIKPDVLVLDIEMPVCDGFGVLRELRRNQSRIWTVMFSTLTQRGAAQTIEALSLGAHDYVSKPTSITGVIGYREGIEKVAADLIPKIKQFVSKRPGPAVSKTEESRPRQQSIELNMRSMPEIVGIGISTGGPEALSRLLPKLPKDFPVPILIVQHMPALFTKLLAQRLDADSKISVREGAEGMPLEPGVAYFAPGDFHLVIRRQGTQVAIGLNKDPSENSCRPAVDVLFRSIAEVYGERALAVIMTGMGKDGLNGIRIMKEKGASVIAQDEATSVVWGMPSCVVKEGLAELVLPLDLIAEAIQRCFTRKV